MSKNRYKRKMKIKFKSKYLLLILIATLLVGIGFAKVTSQILQIVGEAEIEGQTGVFITDIVQTTNVGANTAESRINYYRGTVFDSTVVLGNTASSSINYEITVYNSSDRKHVFIGALTDKEDESVYSNPNIDFSVNGLQNYITTINPYETLKFTITFEYAGGNVSNNRLSSLINFRFKEVPNIVLENEGETIELEGIFPGETIELPFTVTYYGTAEEDRTAPNANYTYYFDSEPKIAGMKYTLESLIDAPLGTKILDVYGNEVPADKEITISEEEGNDSTIHYYTLQTIWDKQYNGKEYEIENFAGNVELTARPNDDKYLDYKIEKSFDINAITDMDYFKTKWSETTLPEEWNGDVVTAMTDGTNIIPLPKGFTISRTEGEDIYENGVVIKDSSDNEFVWVPYTGASTYDLRSTGYVEEELAYPGDKTAFENTINAYNGFWIGRYNTTYDSFDEASDSYLGVGVKKSGKKLPFYIRIEEPEFYTGKENCIMVGVNHWQDFYDLQNSSITANGVYSKMVSYLMCEMASGIKNVSSVDGVWTQTAVPGDSWKSMCFYGTKNAHLTDEQDRVATWNDRYVCTAWLDEYTYSRRS